jgi:hypothetical protein
MNGFDLELLKEKTRLGNTKLAEGKTRLALCELGPQYQMLYGMDA